MDKTTRAGIEKATQRARRLLEDDFAEQLEGTYDVLLSGQIAPSGGTHLTPRQRLLREKIVAALEHKRAGGMKPAEAVADYLRDAAFTALNRFVALKMLEARDLVLECISKGDQSSGYREFCGLAPGVPLLPDGAGYRLYLECILDELSTEVKVLFDRRDAASVLWPRRLTLDKLLETLNGPELAGVWQEDETIGWVYQYFNSPEERRAMREASQAPQNSRELAVRNQFFTPRYVVQFLTDNTLGRIWYETRGTKTSLAERCEYMVRKPNEEFAPRAKKDPRDLRVLDPACGSGHFLLYAFDLLLVIYEEALADPESPKSEATGKTLMEDYPNLDALRRAVPGLILTHNLHGVDIDPRCAQIAQLALWMRAQKAYRDFGIGRAERPQIRRSNIVVAEPLVADEQIAKEFVAKLGDAELGRVFRELVESLSRAGELGLLLHVEQVVGQQAKRDQTGDLFTPPEERIRAALDRFVGEERVRSATNRLLFVEDAAQGFGLLGIAEQRFAVVLMNPPFGEPVRALPREYKSLPKDLYCCFVERASSLLEQGGKAGAISSASFRTYVDYQSFRERFFVSGRVPLMADLGWGVLDGAYVETAAYVVDAPGIRHERCTFVDARGSMERSKALRFPTARGGPSYWYERSPNRFAQLAGKPLIYWWSDDIWTRIAAFPSLNSLCSAIGKGAGPHTIFYRLRWEVDPSSIGMDRTWVTFFNGGAFSPFYRENAIVLQWENRGALVKAYLGEKYPYLKGNTDWNIQLEELYGRSGITYGKKTTTFSAQVMPEGGIFSFEGIGVFPQRSEDTWWLLGYLNSTFVRWYLNATCGLHKNPPYVRNVPVPEFDEASRRRLATWAKSGWTSQASLAKHDERSPFFFGVLSRSNEKGISAVGSILSDIDREVERWTGIRSVELVGEEAKSNEELESENEDSEDSDSDRATTSAGLLEELSWLVGVSFGRFDPRLATDERAIPLEPDPFAPLRSQSPGMWLANEAPAKHAILVDDEGHTDDMATCVRAFAERVRVDVPENLRGWLARDFFPLHIKMYSKSRRKAPIYWQLATPSASYSVWLYIHAFSRDTLFRVQNDYVGGERGKLAHEERRLESLTRELRDGTTHAQRRELAVQESFVEELRTFLEEVKRVAPLWNPNLDDGVIINFAPLWRLVPHHKPWQKELKSTWDALCAGKYDWAHLAMYLWPERVVPKCVADRSLAIAHELEDVFWMEGEDGKWKPRPKPARPVDELVRERTSAAVKAALKSLLEAPVAPAGNGRGRPRRGRRASGTPT